jgi:hypothetical protein
VPSFHGDSSRAPHVFEKPNLFINTSLDQAGKQTSNSAKFGPNNPQWTLFIRELYSLSKPNVLSGSREKFCIAARALVSRSFRSEPESSVFSPQKTTQKSLFHSVLADTVFMVGQIRAMRPLAIEYVFKGPEHQELSDAIHQLTTVYGRSYELMLAEICFLLADDATAADGIIVATPQEEDVALKWLGLAEVLVDCALSLSEHPSIGKYLAINKSFALRLKRNICIETRDSVAARRAFEDCRSLSSKLDFNFVLLQLSTESQLNADDADSHANLESVSEQQIQILEKMKSSIAISANNTSESHDFRGLFASLVSIFPALRVLDTKVFNPNRNNI